MRIFGRSGKRKRPAPDGKADQKVFDDIDEYGWHSLGVFDADEPPGPDFRYTIGVYETFGHPELIIVGLDLRIMHSLLSNFVADIRSGKEFIPDTPYADQLEGNHECYFVDVKKKHYKDYFGTASWYYRSNAFPVRQFVWPSKSGPFPWDESWPEDLVSIQPLLGRPPHEI